MNLSKRMSAVCALVRPAETIADIGCDHGYVSIELVRAGCAKRVIAADVRPGPLAAAEKNIGLAGMSDRIETRLSDGFHEIRPGEAQAAVIAGMGGDLCLRILREAPEVLRGIRQLVLQPQSEIARVREEIFSLGFAIDAEDMVEEDGKHYMMFSAVNVGMLPETLPEGFTTKAWGNPAEYRYGRFLLAEQNPVLRAFLAREYQKFEEVLENLRVSGVHPERMAELAAEQRYREEALSRYEMQGSDGVSPEHCPGGDCGSVG